MKMLMAAILLFASAALSFGQAKKFLWADALCEFEGSYDAKKYTETQLKNTFVLSTSAAYSILIDPTPQRYADIKMLSIENLDEEYKQKSGALKNLDIVKTPYFEDVRQKKLKELEQVYRLKRVTMEAYENPSVLRKFEFAETCVAKYANPLIGGGDDLLNVWREVNEASQRRNSAPERLKKRFDEQSKSAERLQYARMEVMTFGWWNCANEFIEYAEGYDEHEAEFKKLFIRVKELGCDEP